jgi:hypothetical protein
MGNKVEDILIQCVEDIKEGRMDLHGCLDRYPDIRPDLEPLLRIALNIELPENIRPSETFKSRARSAIMEHVRADQAGRSPVNEFDYSGTGNRWFAGWRRAAAVAVSVLVLIAAAGTGTAYASQSSIPGDALYTVKLGTEQVRRIFTFDPASEVDLELGFAATRLDELEELVTASPEQTGISTSLLTMSFIDVTPENTAISYTTRQEKLDRAVAGYEKNLDLAIEKAEKTNDSRVMEKVALTVLDQLERLDAIEDEALQSDVDAVMVSKDIAVDGQVAITRKLAQVNPARAEEISQQAVQSRLKRAETEAAKGNEKAVGNTLKNLEKLRGLSGEIESKPEQENRNNRESDNLTQPEYQEHGKPDTEQPPQKGNESSNATDAVPGTPGRQQQGGTEKENGPGEPEQEGSPGPPADIPGGGNGGTPQPPPGNSAADNSTGKSGPGFSTGNRN